MKIVDRFVCRREGHLSGLTIRNTYGWTSYVTTCLRCGKVFEVHNEQAAGQPGEDAQATKGSVI